jgi:hypothetical protein
MAVDADREAFWDWWIGSEEALVADVSEEDQPAGVFGRLLRKVRGDGGRGLHAALADVDDALALVHPGIFSDYGPHGWVFTGLGDREAYREMVRLVRACPRRVADRPLAGAPRARRDTVTVGAHVFQRTRLRWVSVLRDHGRILGIVVDAPPGAEPDQVRHAAGRFVVSELGEETAVRLQEWRVIAADSQSAQSARPWDDLLPRMSDLLDGIGPDAAILHGLDLDG